ncbi:phosphotransferase family protein [Mastigocoleus testarum]|uniref:Aminoglycoside phosphotransferase n=1 Tax=Mastigocoleus testarum BC008 TaxID=371196 RepID=A0A0V7ZC09_9CYAN|nr:phosphotransferase [Mastigocoleus testarum]KST62046.1 aminoglycoside phosphotransferase [Mastigocoleus testarum BC008]KST62620.1 aminoglycoside phosphotransferase [Mastigocoleus testarum BC008]
MIFRLNSHNVFDYLVARDLCNPSEQALSKIEPLEAKNFNLLLTFSDGYKLLVKQERHDQEGKTAGEFLSEWRIQEFLQEFPELGNLRPLVSEILHFDAENSIIIFRYLDDYRDLMDFYTKENTYPTEVAAAIGTLLGSIHRHTFNRQEYQDFFCTGSEPLSSNRIPQWINNLERIGPEIFGLVSADGLKFFALYQRYNSLGQAIAQLGNAFTPCSLTHNDLKLNNILLHKDWEHESNSIVRLIDWERCTWGDPAFDLGTVISSYVQIWLNSLVISKSLSIEESLRLAMTPLEQIQPSIAALAKAYFHTFPEILEHRPDYLWRVTQFAGFALIQRIEATIDYQKSFGNSGIVMLQVAKTLLCRPEQSILTIFGITANELIHLSLSAA